MMIEPAARKPIAIKNANLKIRFTSFKNILKQLEYDRPLGSNLIGLDVNEMLCSFVATTYLLFEFEF